MNRNPEFNPAAMRAVLEQLESVWRDTFIPSTLAIYKTAAAEGGEVFGEIVAAEYLGALIKFTKMDGGHQR